MSTEENKTLSRRLFTESDTRHHATLEMFAPGFVAHIPGVPVPLGGVDFAQFADGFYAAFPDGRHVIEDQIAEGDKVVTRLTWRGTHQGDFQGISPTGSRVAMTGVAIHRLADGKITEAWMEFDSLGLLQQLGGMLKPVHGVPNDQSDHPHERRAQTMSVDENKGVVRRFLEGPGSGRNLDSSDELFGPGYTNHGLGGTGPAMGLEESKQYARAFFTAFSDAHLTIEEMAAEGELVATRYTWMGTHRGELQGIPASGKQVRVSGISMHRVQNGKIVEDWPGVDMLGLLQQIGAVPQPEPSRR